jgi:hypothetical protein
MKCRELMEMVKSGEVVVDLAGHDRPDAKGHLIERYEREVEMSLGSNDGKWHRSDGEMRPVAEVDADMRAHFLFKLDMEVEPDGHMYDMREEHECRGCGQSLSWVLTNNVLKLRGYFDNKTSDFTMHPFDYVCPYATPKPTTGQIRVKTKLVFANFFREVEDSDDKEARIGEWSLCNLAGRKNITRYKAERNVAYGQMGNMSVGIYVSDDKKSVIVGDPYIFDSRCEGMSDAEYKKAKKNPELKKLAGHTMAGRVSCEVWRWEATDLSLIKSLKKFKEDNKDRGFVTLDVPTGLWSFEHYFDTETCPEEGVYARLRHQEEAK